LEIEGWAQAVEARASWVQVEGWSGTLPASAGWTALDSLAGGVSSPSVWSTLEVWDATLRTVTGWLAVDSRSGILSSPAGWEQAETWTCGTQAPAGWSEIEVLTAGVQATAQWLTLEGWSGALCSPSHWLEIEGWTQAVEARASWVQVEGWIGTGRAPSYWSQVESLLGAVGGAAVWRCLDGWAGNASGAASWLELEILSGDVAASANWSMLEERTCTILTVGGWRLEEQWSGSVGSHASWTEVERWAEEARGRASWVPVEGLTCTLTSPAYWTGLEAWSGTAGCAPSAPNLISPANGSTTNPTPTFQWSATSPLENFRLEVDNDPDFSSPEDNLTFDNTVTSWTKPAPGYALGNYYWRVWAINRFGENCSVVWTFQVVPAPPTRPVLVSPENNATVILPVTFTWIKGDLAENHRIEIDNNENFEDGVVENVWCSPPDDNWYTTENLDYGTYYWRVWAVNALGENCSENTWRFTLIGVWREVESWSGAAGAPSGWEAVEGWTGIVGSVPSWEPLESWAGNLALPIGWMEVEGWAGVVHSLAGWSNVEGWDGTVLSPSNWQSVEGWDGTASAQAGWGALEGFMGVARSPAEWQVVEGWEEAARAIAEWLINDCWIGQVQTSQAWLVIEGWAGGVQATAQWLTLEGWSGALCSPSHWLEIEGWAQAVEARASWVQVEGWSGTLPASAGWTALDSLAGGVSSPSVWSTLEVWDATIRTVTGWLAVDSRSGILSSPAGWEQAEAWTCGTQAPAGWSEIEAWTGALLGSAGWHLLDAWAGTSRSAAGWSPVEAWQGNVQTLAGWRQLESVQATVGAAAGWRPIESWAGAGWAAAGWQSLEARSGMMLAPAGWLAAESWTGGLRTLTLWSVMEAWQGNVQTLAGWRQLESVQATVGAAAGWRPIESWAGAGWAAAGWQSLEARSGMMLAPAGWLAAESWTGGLRTLTLWSVMERWSGTLRSLASWFRGEAWAGTSAAPVRPPRLTAPVGIPSLTDNTPLLEWENLLPADNFDLQLDNDNDFTSPEYVRLGLLTTSHQVENELSPGTYYWRVRQWRTGACSDWSSSWFRIVLRIPTPPVLVSPENASMVRRNVTFVWIRSPEADNHRIEIDNNENFEDGVVENVLFGAFDNTYSTVLDYGTFWWRVWAINPVGENVSENVWCLTVYAAWDCLEGWSAQARAPAGWRSVENLTGQVHSLTGRWFGVEGLEASLTGRAVWKAADYMEAAVRTLGAPTLFSPENDSWTNDNTPTLDWQDVPGALEYMLLVDNDWDLNTPLVNSFVPVSEYTFTFELENGTYYWKVRAKAGELLSPWSAVWQFTVGYDVTPPTSPRLLFPENGALLALADGRPTFGWENSLDLESDRVIYLLQVDNDPDFCSPIYVRSLRENEHKVENVLPQDNYYWRVRAIDGAGNENVSPVFTFRLLVPPASCISPILPYWRTSSPIVIDATASDADGSVTRVELWYRWSSDNSSWGSWILYDYDTAPPYSFSFYPPSGEGYYEFYSRARDNSGNYEQAPAEADARCGYDHTAPPAPTLLAPENHRVLVDSTGRPTFRWSSVTDLGGITYILQVDNDLDFSSPAYELELSENLHQAENVLRQDNYWWRVKVRNMAGLENVSASFRFELLVPPISSVLPISPYWRSASPIVIGATASDADGSVTRVELWYRWSPDNSSWGSWILYDYDTAPPYSFSFYPPSGEGYYEFYSRARDNSGNYEQAPAEADARCGYDVTPPATPSLLAPEKNASVGHWPGFGWTAVTDPSGVSYELAVDDEPSFSEPLVYYRTGILENRHVCENFLEVGIYYWRVRARDGASNPGAWSENFSFAVVRGWISLESWAGRVPTLTAWSSLETFSVRASSFPAGWASLEVLSARAASRASWSYLEFVSSSPGARPAWVRVDGTSSPVCAPVPFTISLSASSGALLQGENLTLTVAVSRLYPWCGTVYLSALNLPPYSSVTFSPSSGAPDFSSTLAISTSTSTPAGSYLLTVTATDGHATVTRTFQLTVSRPPPPKYPPTSALKAISPFWRASLPVPLEAEASDLDGKVVRVLLFYRHSPDNIAWDNWRLYGEDNQAPWSWSFSPAENEGYYELYSVAVDNDGLTEEAPALPDVRIGIDLTSPPVPVPLGPVGDAPTPSKVRLSWVPVSDLSGVQYEVQVDRNSDFSSPLLYSTVENSLEFECPFEGRVFWRVRAVNGSGMASVSGPASFVCIRATPVEKTVSNLPAFTPAEFDLTPMEPLFIRKVTLTFSSPLENATTSVYEFRSEEFAERLQWLPPPEYEYAAWLSLNVPATLALRTKVEFQIFRSWLRERDLDENRVILQRLYQGRWENVPATLVGSDEEKFYYTATFAGFYDLLSATASKRAPPPPPPPPPPVPTPTPPYLFYAFLTMLGAVGFGFAYFLYQRRLVIRPAIPVERVVRPSLPPAIRPSLPPAIPLERLGPRPELKALPIPAKLPPLGVQRVVPKAVPAAGEVLEALKRARPAVPLEAMAKVAKPPVPPAIELERLAKEVKPLPVSEVKKAVAGAALPAAGEVLEALKRAGARSSTGS
jgi:hypothetical protein